MPVRFFEGVRGDMADEINRRNMERRFYALAAAVREHEARTRRAGDGCGRDQVLYLRLRELCGQSETHEYEAV
jgi:hypothetical protein